MKEEIIENIFKQAQQNFARPISKEEIIKIIDETENKLGFELSGYAKQDKPYRQFFDEKTLNSTFPNKRIASVVIEKANEVKDVIAYRSGKTVTYGELSDNILKYASILKNNCNVGSKDIIVMCTPSVIEAIYVFFAANLIGAIVRPLDPISNKETIEKCVKESNSKCLVTLDLSYSKLKDIKVDNVMYLPIADSIPFASKSQKVLLKLLEKISLLKIKMDKNSKWRSFDELLSKLNAEKLNIYDFEEPFRKDEIAAIFPTSGSTGESKGVEITNENCLSSVYKQLYSKFDIDKTDSLFNPMPPSSSYFWYDIVLAAVWQVTTSLSPLFNPKKCAEEILKDESTVVLVGPLLIQRICDYIENMDKKGVKIDLSKKKHFISGGDLLELNLEKRANKILKKCGSNSVIENALGTSETCGPALNPNGVLKNKDTYYEGSVGVVFPGNEMAIFKFDEENNERNIQDENYNRGVMYYEAGEICYNANNPNVFRGYYNNKKSTEETIITHSDGTKWYHTGDLGYMDPAGHSFCLGRKYGLIVRDGHKVWAPKIENIVKSVQGVKDCAIIGVSNKKEKETPACFIVYEDYLTQEMKNNINLELKGKILSQLDNFHMPTHYIELSEIPRNLMMKAKIKELKEIYDKLSVEEQPKRKKLIFNKTIFEK